LSLADLTGAKLDGCRIDTGTRLSKAQGIESLHVSQCLPKPNGWTAMRPDRQGDELGLPEVETTAPPMADCKTHVGPEGGETGTGGCSR
jgi:hypothetical protein